MRMLSVVITMSVILGLAVLILPLCAWGEEQQSPAFELVGPPETASFEKALDRRLGGYAWGIWPRPEKLAGALRGAELPERYVNRLQAWLPRIIRKEFLPDRIDPNQLYGIPRLRGERNFIIGEFRRPEQRTTAQFQSNGLGVVITVQTESLFSTGVDKLSDADIVKTIASLVNYPEDKIKTIILEKHFEEIGETDKKVAVCYGKLRSDGYNEKRAPFHTKEGKMENVPTWWNYMPFWMTKDKLFISCTMVDWETMPASLDPYIFKFGGAK
jgi:hypothetical protein